MTDKAPRARGRPRKEKTIYSKKEEPALVNEVVTPVEVPVEPIKVEPSNAIAEVVPNVEVKTEPIKIPIKVPQKRGKKQTDLKGKQVLTIIDEPVALPVVEPVKEVVKEAPKEPKKSLKTKALPKVNEPKQVKPVKVKPVKQAKAPTRDEDLYRMVYHLQQSVKQQATPLRKPSKYIPSDDDDSSEDDETEEEEEDDDRFHKRIQKRLQTVQHIKQKLHEVRQPPPKGKYEHLSVF